MLIKHLRRDNGIADARFVFKADKHKSLRGAGTLPANNVSTDADGAAVLCLVQIASAPDIGQARTRESHWMRAGGEAGAVVIGSHAFKDIHGEKRRALSMNRPHEPL